jgi:nucleotide-binding universal stress UspA family protein
MKRIVVGVDGSENAQAALRFAVHEARAHGATLEVVHTWQIPYLASPFVPAVSLDPEPFEESAQRLLDAAVDAEDTTGVDVERSLVCDGAAPALLAAAKDADLVVVGARGHGGFVGLLLGSVSEQVARHARCPVVIVPTAE